jgi:hypothetical protein
MLRSRMWRTLIYADYVRALEWAGPRRHVMLQTNAKTKDEMKWLHAQGMDEHHANMEVWDRKLFDWINPGKVNRIGYDNWVKGMLDSVDVLGEGNVRPNFVGGIEMAQPYGFDSVVLPRFNQWRREPRSNLVKEHRQPAIPTEFYVRLMGNRYELWKKYGLPMPVKGNLIPSRNFIGAEHGTYDDYPLLMEAPWYQDPTLRTPEAVVAAGLGGRSHPETRYIHGPTDLHTQQVDGAGGAVGEESGVGVQRGEDRASQG